VRPGPGGWCACRDAVEHGGRAGGVVVTPAQVRAAVGQVGAGRRSRCDGGAVLGWVRRTGGVLRRGRGGLPWVFVC